MSDDKDIMQQLKEQLQTTVVTNVFSEAEFKKQFLLVFKTMSDILSNTLGPYGTTTMIDQETNYSVSKDGFHVLQNLRFADTKMNRIRSTLYSISHQMVTKVGDGSTSAVVAAYSFLLEMLEYSSKNKRVRPKDLNEKIQNIVRKICDVIASNATSITEENLIESVYHMSNIATNENHTYRDMITEIYKTLGANCTINLEESKTFENTVEYEDGVYTDGNYLVDTIYHNRGDRCDIKDCAVLMFDHSLDDTNIWPVFETAFNKFCYKERKTLIVIAPFYDQFLMDKMRKEAEEMVRTYANRATVPFRVIFLKSNLMKPISKDMYKDLASLLGATIYQPVDTKELLKILSNYAKALTEAQVERKDPPDIPAELIESIKNHIGYCEECNMGDRGSSYKGFFNKNEALFNTLFHDAEIKLKEEEERALRNDSVDNKVFDARTRFSKINCKSATIKVGGSNRLEMSINMDAVDDAVKACASAIKYGYNIGCNLAIIKAIDELYKPGEIDEVDATIYEGLRRAFIGVYRRILKNGLDDDKVEDIINQSIEKGCCYNMVSEEFDTKGDIINSCRTDIEILKGAIAMVGVVLSCNQYISITLNH